MKSAWFKNNARELKKTMGRFLAMVSIVALGVAFFVGLKSSRPAMVDTCSDYLDELNFYDLRLLTSIAFDEDAADRYAAMDGVAAAEPSISAPMLTAIGGNEQVFETHMLLPTINQVRLTAGRMPEAPNEVLADDLALGPESLGLELVVDHQEDSLFSQDVYTVVGLGTSPLYLNTTRGSTSLGNGSLMGFLYLTPEGYDADFYTEIYLRLEGDRAPFEPEYLDRMSNLEDTFEPVLQDQGYDRWVRVRTEARQELDDGWAEYHDGVQELEDGRAEAYEEFAKADRDLADAKIKLDDGYEQLADGEETLWKLENDPFSIPELADAKQQLEDGEQELADGWEEYNKNKTMFDENLDDIHEEMRQAEAQLAAGEAQIEQLRGQRQQLAAGIAQVQDGIAQVQAGIAQVQAGIAQIEQARTQAQAGVTAAGAAVAEAQQQLDQANQSGDANAIAQATAAVQAAEQQYAMAQAAYDGTVAQTKEQLQALQGQLAALQAQELELQQQLQTLQGQLQQLDAGIAQGEAELKSGRQQLDNGYRELANGQYALEDAEKELQQAEIDLKDGWEELDREIANNIITAREELADARQELEDGQKEYEDGEQELSDKKAEVRADLAEGEQELRDAYRDLQEGEADLKRLDNPSYFVLNPGSNNGFSSFDNDSQIIASVADVFPLFFFLVAALVCSSTMTRMVEEQRTQNGTLKAMGYSDGQIMMRYAGYAGFAAIIGVIIGVIFGTYLFPYVIWDAYKLLYHFGELEFSLQWPLVIISLAAALVCCVGAAVAAAWNDLRQMPAQLMRPKSPKAGKRIFLEYVTPIWNHLSFLAKVSLRNIFRYKKRLIMMILGTGGCLALLIAGMGLKDSISNVADDQYDNINLYDYTVTFDGERSEPEEEAFRAEFEGRYDQCVFVAADSLKVPADRGTKDLNLIATNDPAADEILGLFDGETDLGYPTGDDLYISNSLAESLHLEVGDSLPILLDTNARVEIPIAGIFTNYVFHCAYMSADGYETWFGAPAEIKTALLSTSETDMDALNTDLQNADDVVNVTTTQSIRDIVADSMNSLDAVVALVVACATALSFVVGYNLININITERVREIATIKVLGFYRSETYIYVFRESILLTFLGTIVGIPLGIWLHRFIMNAVTVDFVSFELRIAPLSFVIAVAITLLVTLVVNAILSRKIDRINMAESLKSVE